MSDHPARIVHARPPAKQPSARRATPPTTPLQPTLTSSAAIDAFLKLLRVWKLPPARGWRMLTGLGHRAGSLTSGQIVRVQHLLLIDAGMQAVLGGAAGEWMVTPNDAAVLAGKAPVDFLTRAGTPGYAELARLVSIWAKGQPMFCVSEDEATAIRIAFEQEGELSAGIELRRLFPGIADGAKAREMARVIAGWRPEASVPTRLAKRRVKH